MSGDRKIATYVEAKRAYDALTQAKTDEPELVKSLDWRVRYMGARADMIQAYRALTGGELARAQRALREGV